MSLAELLRGPRSEQENKIDNYLFSLFRYQALRFTVRSAHPLCPVVVERNSLRNKFLCQRSLARKLPCRRRKIGLSKLFQ